MKKLQVFGLAALITVAHMALAASASADYLSTSTGGETAEPTIHWVNEGHLTFNNPIANVSCSSTFSGTPSTHGAGENVSGPISSLTFTGCTNSWHFTTQASGSLAVVHTTGHNGELFWSGTRVHITRFGVDCYLETENTKIGTVTGGNPATLHIEATIPIDDPASDALCGSSSYKWEGNYVTTSALYVVNS